MHTAMVSNWSNKILNENKGQPLYHHAKNVQRINYSNGILFLADQINNYIPVYQPVESVTNILFVRLNLFNHVLALFCAKFTCNLAIRYPIFRWELYKGSV